MKYVLKLHVNGEDHEVLTETHKTLLEVLREDLALQGPSVPATSEPAEPARFLSTGSPTSLVLLLPWMFRGRKS